jgi:hypothetical protein
VDYGTRHLRGTAGNFRMIVGETRPRTFTTSVLNDVTN